MDKRARLRDLMRRRRAELANRGGDAVSSVPTTKPTAPAKAAPAVQAAETQSNVPPSKPRTQETATAASLVAYGDEAGGDSENSSSSGSEDADALPKGFFDDSAKQDELMAARAQVRSKEQYGLDEDRYEQNIASRRSRESADVAQLKASANATITVAEEAQLDEELEAFESTLNKEVQDEEDAIQQAEEDLEDISDLQEEEEQKHMEQHALQLVQRAKFLSRRGKRRRGDGGGAEQSDVHLERDMGSSSRPPPSRHDATGAVDETALDGDTKRAGDEDDSGGDDDADDPMNWRSRHL